MRWLKGGAKGQDPSVEPVDNQFGSDPGPEEGQFRSSAPPVARRKRVAPSKHIDADTHASALKQLLQEHGHYEDGYMLTFTEIKNIYLEMCAHNHWRPRGWGSIARRFDLLTTGGAKPYQTFYDEDGRVRRLRVYPIPTPD